jgi:hypothetical protein
MNDAANTPPQDGPASPAGGPSPGAARLLRFARNAAVVGLVISLCVHLAFLAVANVIRTGGGSGMGAGAGGNSPVEVAIMSESELASIEERALDAAAPGVEQAIKNESMPALVVSPVEGGQGAGERGDLGSIGTGLGGAGSGEGIGVGDGAGGSGGGGTSFFGVEVRGSRFAYICDISGSMQGPKLATLKRELITSLDNLTENGHFVIIFFESTSVPLGNQERWLEGSHKNKQWAEQQIRQVEARGGTEPAPAFVSVMAMRPRPDAIYFMTDGLFNADVAERVAAMNRTGKTIPVHCIAFGDRSAEALMRKMAKDSGGTYTFVEQPR